MKRATHFFDCGAEIIPKFIPVRDPPAIAKLRTAIVESQSALMESEEQLSRIKNHGAPFANLVEESRRILSESWGVLAKARVAMREADEPLAASPPAKTRAGAAPPAKGTGRTSEAHTG